MSFNMLAMLYMKVAKLKIKLNRQANSSYLTKKRLTKLGRRKPTSTITRNPTTVNVCPKIEAICRVCGKYGNDNISIFDNTGDRNIVNDMISIATVQVEKNDGLPTHICARCLDLLNNALLFKRSCEKTDRELRKIHIKTEKIEIKEEKIDINDPGRSRSENFCNAFDQRLVSYLEIDNVPMSDEDYINQGFFDCLKCGNIFLNKHEYKIHLSNCDSIFKKSLYEVKKVIPEAFPNLCDICGKMFKQENNLKRHRMVHTDELPFKCDLCPYRGRNKDVLRLHIRVHTGERPYKCPLCPRTFINLSNRKKHQSVHTNLRPYKCSICNKGLVSIQSLEHHEKSIHFGVRDHKCDVCGTCLGSKTGLQRHRRRVHNIRALHPKFNTYLQIDERKKAKQQNDTIQNKMEYENYS